MLQEHETTTYIDAEPVEEMNRSGRAIATYCIAVGTVAFLMLLAWALWLVQEYLVYLGYVVLGGASIVIVCLVATPIVFLLRLMFKADARAISQHGTVFKPALGAPIVIAPQLPMQAMSKAQGKGKKEKAQGPVMLSLFEMIEQKIIEPGQTKFVYGYELNGELAIGDRTPTQAIGGKGRSGKSRRAVFHIAQDLIGGAKIVVCDPHGKGKRDALAKLLQPLAPWIVLACDEESILRETNTFVEEMRKRLGNTSEEQVSQDGFYLPRVIVYDEWSALMTRYSEETATTLKGCLEDCSREFGGVQGYAIIIGQSWVAAECGGTGIRRALHDVFVHNLNPEYAKFLMVNGPWKKTEDLPVKNCYHKPFQGKIRELVTPFVSDDAPMKLAEIMRELYPVEAPKEIAEFAHSRSQPKEAQSEAQEHDTPYGQIVPSDLMRLYQLAQLPSPVTTPENSKSEPEKVIYLGGSTQGSQVNATQGVQPVGRDLFLEQLDKVVNGDMSVNDVYRWATGMQKPGGRKYTARAQVIRQLQDLAQAEHEPSQEEQQSNNDETNS